MVQIPNQTALLSALLIFLPIIADSSPLPELQPYQNSGEIICNLMKKSASTSYAYDMVDPHTGRKVKRMYFAKFPQKAMRTEWIREGQPYVFIGNLEGTYEYYPLRQVAYFEPSAERQKATREFFKCDPEEWTAKGSGIIGEEVIDGRECYLLKLSLSNKEEGVNCVDKETGHNLTLEQIKSGKRQVVWYYRNYAFDLDESLFRIPEGVQIITR